MGRKRGSGGGKSGEGDKVKKRTRWKGGQGGGGHGGRGHKVEGRIGWVGGPGGGGN